MQSVSSRIWTCVAVSISCGDNHGHLFSGSLYEWPRVSYKKDSPGIYLFDEISAIQFAFE